MAGKRGQTVRWKDINLKFPIGGDSCSAVTENNLLLLWAIKIFFWLPDGKKMYCPLCASVWSVSVCTHKERLYIKLIKITVYHFNLLFKLITSLKIFKNLAMVYQRKNFFLRGFAVQRGPWPPHS